MGPDFCALGVWEGGGGFTQEGAKGSLIPEAVTRSVLVPMGRFAIDARLNIINHSLPDGSPLPFLPFYLHGGTVWIHPAPLLQCSQTLVLEYPPSPGQKHLIQLVTGLMIS